MKYRIREQNELKPSGVEWLGDIPKGWCKSKMLYYYKAGMGQTILKEDLKDNGQIPVYSATAEDKFFGFIDDASILLNKNDLVIPARGNSIGYVKLVKEISTTTQTTIYCKKISKSIYSEFIFYYMKGLKEKLFYFVQTAIPQITVNEVLSNPILIPSILEQQKIANFLDEKSKIFDEAISKKEQLISKLELAKQSLISEVVTGKLRVVEQNSKLQTIKREKNELKASGVEWLGDIPKDWQIKKLKYISEIISSNVDKKSYEGQEKVLLCNYVDVYKNDFITNKINFMEATASESEIKKFSLQLGDILITKDSESPNDIAIPAYVIEEFENVLCGYHLAILRNNKNEVYSKYLYRFFQLISIRNYFETMAKGVTRYGLSLDAFKNIFVPNFDLEEQQKISKYLDEKLIHFDNTIEKTKQSITKLKEAKEALISQVVTGKIEVL
ncbi:restriction endonuclease subunit S [Aliarcobacter cryaerophilus]|uniref:restriction endonuclease subunit S n=1 Tax=Aliarcobacter cryaerophilus TaxID=28198 RepID=UPI0021B3EA1D|nr:restriction endonuclease subunit S [Aliarcobacter cryaerophilus]MCT7463001.1 restriction endonuclease subunit S [Aliarcobacter cryaerophilus]